MFKILLKLFQSIFGSKNSNTSKVVSSKEKSIEKSELEIEKEEESFLDSDQEYVEIPEKEPVPIPKAASIKDYFLSEGEYFSEATEKSWIFLHHTLGWHDPFAVIDQWNRDTRGAVGTEYIIGGQSINGNKDFDGKLLRAIPNNGWAWHLGVGRNELHSNSIGVELNCFGPLTKGGYFKKINGKKEWIEKNKHRFYSYTGSEVAIEQVCELEQEFRGYKYWHDYSDKQILVLRSLLIELSEEHNINITKGLAGLIKNKGSFKAFDLFDRNYVTKNKGIWSHSNVKSYKSDTYPNPKLVQMLLSF